jgi:putative acetyltransferase
MNTVSPDHPSSVEIRAFAIEAYDQVLALWRQCEGVGLSRADSREAILAYLDRNPGMSLIACEGDTVVGAILCGHDGRRGYIHHLAVHPGHRRRGIGRAIAERCLDDLKRQGIDKCHIFIFNTNQTAIAFWRAMGWSSRRDIGIFSKDIR